MAPNSLNFISSPSSWPCFSIYSIFTFSFMLLECVLMLTFLPQTMTTASRNHGKALIDPFAPSNFDFDWDSLDNLRLWRWRNRNRGLRQRERDEKRARQLQAKASRANPDWQFVPRPTKRGGGGWDQTRHVVNKKSDPYLTKIDFQDSCCPTVKEVVSPTSGRNSTGHLVELYQDDKIHQQFYEVSCRHDIVNQPCRFLENRHSKSSKCTQQHTLTYALVRPHINHTAPVAGGAHNYNYNNYNGPQYREHIIKVRSQDLFQLQQKQSTYASNSPSYGQQGQQQSHGFVDIIAAMMSNGAVLHQPWYLDYITIRSGCSCTVVRTRRRKKAYY